MVLGHRLVGGGPFVQPGILPEPAYPRYGVGGGRRKELDADQTGGRSGADGGLSPGFPEGDASAAWRMRMSRCATGMRMLFATNAFRIARLIALLRPSWPFSGSSIQKPSSSRMPSAPRFATKA